MKKEILIIDIETTGFLRQGGKIVEVGIISLNIETGEKCILYDQVMHERPITKEEVENSWIVTNGYMSVSEIQKSPELKTLQNEIQEIINKYPLGATAYNNSFDFGFLEDRGFVFPKKLPCPMKLSTHICQIPSPRGFGYKWPKVEEAFKFFFPDSNYFEKHRGADDAYHEADIVMELIKIDAFKFD